MKELIDSKSPVPMYFQLKGILAKHIVEKRLQMGDKLPSIRKMIDGYGVSLPVVRQALIELEKDGIINIEKGRGSYIVKIPQPPLVKTKSIIFLFCGRDFLDPYFSKVLAGAEKEANLKGFSIIYNGINGHNHYSLLHERTDLTGVILTGDVTMNVVKKIQGRKIPFVLAGDLNDEKSVPKDVNSIVNNDREGSYLAVKYLLSLGHRKISMFTGRKNMFVWKERLKGYEKALNEYGISVQEDYVIECKTDTSEEGYDAMSKLFEKHNLPTAIFTGNDRYALGAYRLLNEKGLQIPDDISIIGFDDLDFAKELIPPLTTIRANMEEIGHLAFHNLLNQISDSRIKPKREILPTKLIKRSSCKNV